MLVTSEKMLLSAQRNGYAVGAFNAENMEMVIAIVETASELNAPVIIQTTPSTNGYVCGYGRDGCEKCARTRRNAS